jgi:hypothetical protein
MSTILHTVLESRHVRVFSKEDYSQFLLKVLVLITATLRRSPGPEGKLEVHLENVGKYYHYIVAGEKSESTTSDTANTPVDSDDAIMEDAIAGANASDDIDDLGDNMTIPFALPAPARENLLSFVEHLLSSWFVRSASLQFRLNVPVTTSTTATGCTAENDNDNDNNIIMVLHWKPIYRMLYRTNPKLDEFSPGLNPPSMAHSRRGIISKKTANIAMLGRHFFDQHGALDVPNLANGATIHGKSLTLCDKASNEIWALCQPDLKRTHTNLMFRGVVMMYLFLPWACTPAFFDKVIPECLECWSAIDRCNDFDFLWLQLLCRARFHDSTHAIQWTYMRKKILSNCAYWLQIPVTGASNDRSFPTIRAMKSRTFPSTLKSLYSSGGNAYQEGIEFVDRLSSLLIFCVGRNDSDSDTDTTNIGINLEDVEVVENASDKANVTLSSGTADLIRFLSFVGPYFNPTNIGGWTFPLGVLLTSLCTQLARRLGLELGQSLLLEAYPDIGKQMSLEDDTLIEKIPPQEIPPILDALLPLVQQSIYSKDGFVGKAGEQSLFTLSQISAKHVCPYFLEFATKALDISAIHQSHQAPSALGVLARLLPSTLRREPSEILQRIPMISSLILAGIDSNDRKKTILTLSLVHSIASWLPMGAGSLKQDNGGDGGVISTNSKQTGCVQYADGTFRLGSNLVDRLSLVNESPKFQDSMMALSNRTVLQRPALGDVQLDKEEKLIYEQEHLMEASMALGDWSLLFLERIYELMRAAGKLEKVSKDHLGASARHSASDASQAKSFSRMLMGCLIHVFVSMDKNTHKKAVESVCQFITGETLPFSAKDAASLCTAACVGDYAQEGFEVLVPALTKDMDKLALRTATYRLRCLTGAVKFCGTSFCETQHRDAIVRALDHCLNPKLDANKDKHLFKVGCKLLRHTLASQVEAYPLFTQCGPNTAVPGKGAELHNHDIEWHIPSGAQIDFGVTLMEQFAFARLRSLLSDAAILSNDASDGDAVAPMMSEDKARKVLVPEWRDCLKVLKYTLRGGIGIMADDSSGKPDSTDLCPVERDLEQLLESTSPQTKRVLLGLRGKLCVIITYILGAIANETYEASEDSASSGTGGAGPGRTASATLSFDTKICCELAQVSDLLLTYRGSLQIAWGERTRLMDRMEDELLANQTSHMITSLERAGQWTTHHDSLMRDGEDAGRIMSGPLRVTKVWGGYLHLQANAAYNIPRRMMKERVQTKKSLVEPKQGLFAPDRTMRDVKTLSSTYLIFGAASQEVSISPLDAYEGLLDGLQSLSCHPKLHVRSSANETLDSGLSCFSFLARQRLPRLLRAIQLDDGNTHGKYGVPSCARLAETPEGASDAVVSMRRKRLAEVLKGVCNLLSKPRMIRHVAASEQTRLHLIKTLCGTEKLLSILPTEELQKMVHFLQVIFSKFRQRWHALPRFNPKEKRAHQGCLLFLLIELDGGVGDGTSGSDTDTEVALKPSSSMEGSSSDSGNTKKMMHWRNQLLAMWFLTHLVDPSDVEVKEASQEGAVVTGNVVLLKRLWALTFALIEKHEGQPIQRAALGFMGRLLTFAERSEYDATRTVVTRILEEKFADKAFCRTMALALAFNHRQDTAVGGGHKAQWSAGIEDILRDAAINLSPMPFFPLLRSDNLTSTSFKLSHVYVLGALLKRMDFETAQQACERWLVVAKDLSETAPSEDQKNMQVTTWELFAAVFRFYVTSKTDADASEKQWKRVFTFFDEVLVPLPYELASAAYDAVKFTIDYLAPSQYRPLTDWLISRISMSLWQPESGGSNDTVSDNAADDNSVSMANSEVKARVDGFSSQSKWLRLGNAVLNELRNESCRSGRVVGDAYVYDQLQGTRGDDSATAPLIEGGMKDTLEQVVDKMMPLLVKAVGHPYEKCRSLIASSLYCICMLNNFGADKFIEGFSLQEKAEKPMIHMLAMKDVETTEFKERLNCLKTTKQFLLYSLHRGDVVVDFQNLVIPLLPAAFSSLKLSDEDEKSSEGDENTNVISAPDRALEAEVANDFRYMLSCVGSVFVTLDHAAIGQVLSKLDDLSKSETWHIRQAVAHYLRCFQGCHKFIFTSHEAEKATNIVASLLADERREVSAGAMGALTGILAVTDVDMVSKLVDEKLIVAKRSIGKKKKKAKKPATATPGDGAEAIVAKKEVAQGVSSKEKQRLLDQQSSVYFLCAVVLARPYDTPAFVPVALEALSRHSFEQRAPLAVRDTVKKCFSEFKRTHMTDNWELHRQQFSREQLEALEDVVSTPHYYA